MKVYIVYGNLCRDDDCDYKIHGVFDSSEKAIDYAFQISIETLSKHEIPTERWKCCFPKDIENCIFGILDTWEFEVELYDFMINGQNVYWDSNNQRFYK